MQSTWPANPITATQDLFQFEGGQVNTASWRNRSWLTDDPTRHQLKRQNSGFLRRRLVIDTGKENKTWTRFCVNRLLDCQGCMNYFDSLIKVRCNKKGWACTGKETNCVCFFFKNLKVLFWWLPQFCSDVTLCFANMNEVHKSTIT